MAGENFLCTKTPVGPRGRMTIENRVMATINRDQNEVFPRKKYFVLV